MITVEFEIFEPVCYIVIIFSSADPVIKMDTQTIPCRGPYLSTAQKALPLATCHNKLQLNRKSSRSFM